MPLFNDLFNSLRRYKEEPLHGLKHQRYCAKLYVNILVQAQLEMGATATERDQQTLAWAEIMVIDDMLVNKQKEE